MLDQFFLWKSRYPDCLLLFRMGDFYETFFDDAREASSLLDIVLTARDPDRAIPMAGVPVHALESYLGRLVAAGRRVAICEQLTEPDGRSLVERAVVRVVTPGTYVPEDAREEGRLAALLPTGRRVALARILSSTGECEAGTLSPEEAADALAAFAPGEVLIPRGAADRLESLLAEGAPGAARTEREPSEFDPISGASRLERRFGLASASALGFDPGDPAPGACAAAIRYLEETQFSSVEHLLPPRPIRSASRLFLDRSTQAHLELTEGEGPTLLGTLDRCVTPMGRRLLRIWILEPLLDPEAIAGRQEAVASLAADPSLLSALRGLLSGCRDVERAVGRLCLKSGTPRDLGAIRDTLARLPETADLARAAGLGDFAEFPDLRELAAHLERSLAEEPPRTPRDGGVIRGGFDAELDALRDLRDHGDEELRRFEESERERTGIRTLKVGYNRVFGYTLEIGRAAASKAPPDYERRQTLANAERFVTPELKALETRLLDAGERILRREEELYRGILERTMEERGAIQTTGARLAALDVLASLALIASERRYVRPVVDRGSRIEVRMGRHPVLEAAMPDRPFVPNDLLLDSEGDVRVAILTGPNMAGKSTILRMAALIQILAQMGSFVPADSARVGLCDRVFSRIGARDELARGRSTFLVEMVETANILRNLTDRSLVVLDEVGRGTSTYDGMSIAWAVLEHLQGSPGRPKVLFATHYHELARLADRLPGVANWSLEVREEGDRITFLHRLVPRPADRSYGIDVARLAGIPEEVVLRSRELLARFEAGREGAAEGVPPVSLPHAVPDREEEREGGRKRGRQLALFDPEEDGLTEELAALEPERMTPLQALEKLFELRDRALARRRRP